MIKIIGISGKKGHGKNLVADIIQYLTSKEAISFEEFQKIKHLKIFHWETCAFADKLKEMTSILIGCNVSDLNDSEYKEKVLWTNPSSGRDVTPRYILQYLGTNLGRELHPDIWIKALQNSKFFDSNLIITDVRFPNEAKFIENNNGLLIRINRPQIKSDDTHPSEISLDNYQFKEEIINNGSVENLVEKVEQLLKKYSIL